MNTKQVFLSRASVLAASVVCAAAIFGSPVSFGQADPTTAPPAHHHRTLEQRLADLKTALQITSDQESLWQAYVTAATNQAAAWKQWRMSNPPSPALTLPQRIDRRNAMMQQLQPGRQAVDAALKQLYAALSPSQQTTIEIFMAHSKHRHGRG